MGSIQPDPDHSNLNSRSSESLSSFCESNYWGTYPEHWVLLVPGQNKPEADERVTCSSATILLGWIHVAWETRTWSSYCLSSDNAIQYLVDLPLWLAICHYLRHPLVIRSINRLPSASHSANFVKLLCKSALFSHNGFGGGPGYTTMKRETLHCCLPAEAFACNVLLREKLYLDWILQLERYCVQVYEARFKPVPSRVSI